MAAPGSRVVGEWTISGPGREDVHVALTSRVIASQDADDDVILVNVVDLSERRRYEQRLAHLADHDALTGLPNRRRFDAALAEHLDLCARSGPRGALLLLDLDHFKEVNDTLGHDAGDDLIVSVAAVLRGSLRETDLVARLGGDEFAVLLPDADREGAVRVAEVVVERVRANSRTLEGVNRRVTASIGVVTFAGADERAEDILALADMLMYDAKDAGRDRFTVIDDSRSVQPRSGARMEWKTRIEAALENDDFELYLQPLLNLDTGRVTGAEALIRLVDRDVPVSPGAFIGVAERAGLAPAVDGGSCGTGWRSCAGCSRSTRPMRLSVNLSAHSIGDREVALTLERSLRDLGVDPSRLTVEVTETAAVADIDAARRFAEPLRALGVEFALDDFGAGYGSFYYLKHLSFDTIKIDGEFVKGAADSAVDRAILRSVIGIARALGKRTVAEFVTDESALSVVRELGVDYAQGYLIGRAGALRPVRGDPPRRRPRAVARSAGGRGRRAPSPPGARPRLSDRTARMPGGDARARMPGGGDHAASGPWCGCYFLLVLSLTVCSVKPSAHSSAPQANANATVAPLPPRKSPLLLKAMASQVRVTPSHWIGERKKSPVIFTRPTCWVSVPSMSLAKSSALVHE